MYQSFIAALCLLIATPLWALETTIVFLSKERENIAVLSNLDPIPEDIGQAGFDLGIADNQSTGKFLKQTYKAHSSWRVRPCKPTLSGNKPSVYA